MANINPFQTQQQIRNNAAELADCLSDLKSWKNDTDKKEKQLKQKTNNNNNQNDLPPIRNQTIAENTNKKNQKLAIKYKNEGNNYFKAKNYLEAIKSYSLAIKVSPENAILYNNRAMAKLKNNDFIGAEIDCTRCIQLDSSLIKAWFRRGLSRKYLKKYNKSLEDFQRVLKFDKNNKPAKKEINQIKLKLKNMFNKYKKNKNQKNPKNVVKNKVNNNKMKRIVIEECTDSDTDTASDADNDVKNDNDDGKMDDKLLPSVNQTIVNKNDDIVDIFTVDNIPRNFIDFEKMWSRAKTSENRSLILLKLKNKNLSQIIKNMIDDTLFSELIQTIHYIAINVNIKDSLIMIKQISVLDRIEMLAPFMDDKDQKLLHEIKQKCLLNKLNVSVFDKFQ